MHLVSSKVCFALYLVFLGPMIWERGLTPVCLVVSTLLPWRNHTLNFCLFVCFIIITFHDMP
jgi:hypothetical protein